MNIYLQFLISSIIWWCLFLPMVLVSFPVVAVMLLTKWDGTTTWFGNFKYGRGDTHYKAPSNGEYLKQWNFLCLRNPVSNYGKKILSVQQAPWVWLYDVKIVGNFFWKFGWKSEDSAPGELRTFIYRPWLHK